MGKHLDARMAKLEQQVDAVFGPLQPRVQVSAERQAQLLAWFRRLLDSMAPRHLHLLRAWLEDLGGCHHALCPVPRGLSKHLDILRDWIGDERKPVALPPDVIEVYLTSDPGSTFPHLDCELCSYPCPISGFFAAQPIFHFPRCPICGGTVGWHAWDIKQQSPGYKGLVPYGLR